MDSISQKAADKNGNFIIIMTSGNVFLHLNSKKKRRIGYIDRAKKTFVVKRKREQHLFRKLNSYGINEFLMRTSKSFDKVLLTDEFGEYTIPVSDIMAHGKTYLHFKHQGFELQLFVAIEILEKYKKTVKIDVF